ncbi:MAG: adaptin N terminal region-domain-containing protein, partial [Olpidium bornovanus]
NVQHNNAQNAILFEAISLAIHLDPESPLVNEAAVLMGRFIASKETNIRYLALDAMAHLAAFCESLEPIKKHQETIIQSLRDRDISVRRRGLDLLYSMCDVTNAKEIVAELLRYLSSADYEIREEMVLKIAILAEKFATENSWYVDTILQLITTAGDHVGDEVWYRVTQIVANNEDLQEYAARMVLNVLRNPGVHETAVKTAGYILGEFGHLIANQPGSSPIEQFTLLQSRFSMCRLPTRALLLTTYIKFANLFPEIKHHVLAVFDQYQHVLDVELQQRACEYAAIARMPTDDVLQTLCEEMPPFPERESALLSKIEKRSQATEDKRTWNVGGKDANRAARHDGRQQAMKAASAASSAGAPAQPSPSIGTSPTVAAKIVEQDLLGLIDFGCPSSSPAVQSQPPPSSSEAAGLLALGDARFGAPIPGSEKWYDKLVYTTEGVLFEDDVLQVGLKSEYHHNLGRLALYFGNKTQSPLHNFGVAVQSTPEVTLNAPAAVASTISPVTQIQQLLNIECSRQFSAPVLVRVGFTSVGGPRSFVLRVPVTLNKFFEPIVLPGHEFFGRWKQIG